MEDRSLGVALPEPISLNVENVLYVSMCRPTGVCAKKCIKPQNEQGVSVPGGF